jgi:excisionase family DNA binding protein
MRTEEFITLKEAAERLNLHYHQLQRASKKGLFPTYTPFGRRIYVRLSEVTAAIEAARVKSNSA